MIRVDEESIVMEKFHLNLYEPGDKVRRFDSDRIGVVISLFYLPYRENCKHGIPDTYEFPELIVYDDGSKKIDEDNWLRLSHGWVYIVTYLNGRDDEVDFIGENCVVLVDQSA